MAYFVQLERSSSFIRIKWIKHALAHSFELQVRANFYSTLGGIWRVYIPSLLFMGAKMSVLGLIISFLPYLRSAMVRFPLSRNPYICSNPYYPGLYAPFLGF